ncbi:ribosome biogenesis protein WDR12 homolog [Megalopta genalis]|uniref:ribosome biogenesis protein WDR12 homolog n=1 Tax=Megalopta genalis TaxID=115081 RepID=UPI003FD65ABC
MAANVSHDCNVAIKLGPFIKRDDGDEYLPLEMTIHGYGSAWIETELKKREDNTFDYGYKFSFCKSNIQVDNSQPSSHEGSPYTRKTTYNLQSLNAEEQLLVKHMAAQLCKDIAKHAKPKKQRQKVERNDKNASAEGVKTVTFGKEYSKPRIQRQLKHTQTVSAVAVCEEWILTGCSDGSLHIWTYKGNHRIGVRGHKTVIVDVQWVSMKQNIAMFISASKDGAVIIWVCNMLKNSIVFRTYCSHDSKGVFNTLNVLSVHPNKTILAVGGWDGLLKFWTTSTQDRKKLTKNSARKPKTIIKNLDGHKDVVTGIAWSEKNEVVSCSFDETIKVWDYESGRIIHDLGGGECFYSLDYSPLRRSILATTHDKIRLYDLRDTGNSTIVKKVFAYHKEPVKSLRWSPVDQNLFILGGARMQLWDIRRPRTPLYDLRDHQKDVLCCDWSNPKMLAFGGEDKIVRLYKFTRV